MKLIQKVDDVSTREGLHQNIRSEFEGQRQTENIPRIEYLLADGRKRYTQLKGMLSQTKDM